MPAYIGDTAIGGVYVGDTAASKVYLGDTEVWSSAPPLSPPVFEAAGTGYSTSTATSSWSWSHTSAGGTDAVVIIAATFAATAAHTVPSCTYGGVSLVGISFGPFLAATATQSQSQTFVTTMWIHRNPAAGTKTVVITPTTTAAAVASSVSYTGVGYVGAPETSEMITGTTKAVSSQTVSSNERVVFIHGVPGVNATFTGYDQTQRVSIDNTIASTSGCQMIIGEGNGASGGGTVSATATLSASTSRGRCFAVRLSPVPDPSSCFLVGSSFTAASSTTMDAHAVGDLMIIYAYRSNSATPPSLPAGWTDWPGTPTVGGTTNSARVGWKIATDTTTSSNTWTNATHTLSMIYRNATGPGNIAWSNGTANTTTPIPMPALTLTNTDGTSHGLRFIGFATADSGVFYGPILGSTQNTVHTALAGSDTVASVFQSYGPLVANIGAASKSITDAGAGYCSCTLEVLGTPT